jgi:hypothetical protein
MLSSLIRFEPEDAEMISEAAMEIACRVLAVASVGYHLQRHREGSGGRRFWMTQMKKAHLQDNENLIQRFYELGQKITSANPRKRQD